MPMRRLAMVADAMVGRPGMVGDLRAFANKIAEILWLTPRRRGAISHPLGLGSRDERDFGQCVLRWGIG